MIEQDFNFLKTEHEKLEEKMSKVNRARQMSDKELKEHNQKLSFLNIKLNEKEEVIARNKRKIFDIDN
jgi:peptidoglycan hydrolase CwlO-like protein